jgi:hypothetical protein
MVIPSFPDMPIPRVKEAHYAGGFTVHIEFSDGEKGDVFLGDELQGEVFEPLRNESFFSRVSVHPEFHTLCWPNGADFAPEFLYEKIQVSA